ncbi:FxsA family protein [Pseudaeromonas sharmana]|uniref:FxsA family protein n=1 Tax=Pseudaeromonas sharmana TaxID=328412 RepID=A0ABV8CRA4_9GAMM
MGKMLLGLLGLFFVEIWVLIKVGAAIGAVTTLVLMVVAAVLGAQLVRSQGIMALLKLQPRLQAGEVSPTELLQGIWLPVAGFLFIFPGFISDLLALVLLQPLVRKALTAWVLSRGVRLFSNLSAGRSPRSATPPPFERVEPDQRAAPSDRNARGGTTIEGEFERKDQE